MICRLIIVDALAHQLVLLLLEQLLALDLGRRVGECLLLDLSYFLPLYPFHLQLELCALALLFPRGFLLCLPVYLVLLLSEFNYSLLEVVLPLGVHSLDLGQLFLVHLFDQLQAVVVLVLLLDESGRLEGFLLSLLELLLECVDLLFVTCEGLFLDGLELFQELSLQSLSDSVLRFLDFKSLLLF